MSDGAVGGVHRPDDVEVFRQLESFALLRVLKVHLLVAVLQKEVQLAEHLGEVAAVYLVYDEEVLGVFIFLGALGGAKQRPLT